MSKEEDVALRLMGIQRSCDNCCHWDSEDEGDLVTRYWGRCLMTDIRRDWDYGRLCFEFKLRVTNEAL